MTYRFGLVACASLLVAGCTTTCDTDDFECIMDHSTFELNGVSVRPVQLPASRVPAPAPLMTGDGTPPTKSSLSVSIIPMSAPNFGDPVQMIQAGKVSAPGGGASGLPAAEITMAPTSVNFTSSPVQTMSIGFTDPYGMTPSFILLPNIGTPKCWAFPPMRDLQIQGIAKIKIDATNVQMTPVSASAPQPTVIMPTPVEPTPIGPTDVQPSVITATPVVSWFQPPLGDVARDDNNNNGGGNNGGGGDPLAGYTVCEPGGIVACNDKSPPQCSSSEECCNSDGYCKICVPNCGPNRVNVWGPCYASACTAEINAAVSFCCPPSN
jgi:hypothetical protein